MSDPRYLQAPRGITPEQTGIPGSRHHSSCAPVRKDETEQEFFLSVQESLCNFQLVMEQIKMVICRQEKSSTGFSLSKKASLFPCADTIRSQNSSPVRDESCPRHFTKKASPKCTAGTRQDRYVSFSFLCPGIMTVIWRPAVRCKKRRPR